MKILRKDLKHGAVVVKTEVLDDLWYLSQVVESGDRVKTRTYRRIKDKEDGRSKGGQRKAVTLGIAVEKSEFNAESDNLRISGTIVSGPEDLVSIGSYHSFNVGEDDTITVVKGRWTRNLLGRLEDAVKSSMRANVIVCILDRGDATVGVVSESRIRYVELQDNFGGKYDTSSNDGKRGFYKGLAETLSRTDGENISAIILAGPGFEKENFLNYLREESSPLVEKMRVDNTGMSGRAGVEEVLKRDSFRGVVGELASARDIRLIEKVLMHVGKDDGLGVYSIADVKAAVDANAVQVLLVSDGFFADNRMSCEKIMNSVRNVKGSVHIVNSGGDPGRQLDSLGGVAAILRYRIG